MRRLIGTSVGALALAGGSLFAAPAQAAPVITGGLVNVTVTDVANNVLQNANVGVGVAAGIAANVCGVNVGGVLGALRTTGDYTCTSNATGNTVDISRL
jgi:hypothetical protein